MKAVSMAAFFVEFKFSENRRFRQIKMEFDLADSSVERVI